MLTISIISDRSIDTTECQTIINFISWYFLYCRHQHTIPNRLIQVSSKSDNFCQMHQRSRAELRENWKACPLPLQKSILTREKDGRPPVLAPRAWAKAQGEPRKNRRFRRFSSFSIIFSLQREALFFSPRALKWGGRMGKHLPEAVYHTARGWFCP